MYLSKPVYYLLSFTWGILVTFAGLIVSAVLLLCDVPHFKNAYGWGFYLGKGWGGFNIGPCSVVCADATARTKQHEFGHSVQNCLLGPFMIPVVIIPSVCRYWYREIKKVTYPPYDSIWFEGQATRWGKLYFQLAKSI